MFLSKIAFKKRGKHNFKTLRSCLFVIFGHNLSSQKITLFSARPSATHKRNTRIQGTNKEIQKGIEDNLGANRDCSTETPWPTCLHSMSERARIQSWRSLSVLPTDSQLLCLCCLLLLHIDKFLKPLGQQGEFLDQTVVLCQQALLVFQASTQRV